LQVSRTQTRQDDSADPGWHGQVASDPLGRRQGDGGDGQDGDGKIEADPVREIGELAAQRRLGQSTGHE
jgi:hypothetical protein